MRRAPSGPPSAGNAGSRAPAGGSNKCTGWSIVRAIGNPPRRLAPSNPASTWPKGGRKRARRMAPYNLPPARQHQPDSDFTVTHRPSNARRPKPPPHPVRFGPASCVAPRARHDRRLDVETNAAGVICPVARAKTSCRSTGRSRASAPSRPGECDPASGNTSGRIILRVQRRAASFPETLRGRVH